MVYGKFNGLFPNRKLCGHMRVQPKWTEKTGINCRACRSHIRWICYWGTNDDKAYNCGGKHCHMKNSECYHKNRYKQTNKQTRDTSTLHKMWLHHILGICRRFPTSGWSKYTGKKKFATSECNVLSFHQSNPVSWPPMAGNKSPKPQLPTLLHRTTLACEGWALLSRLVI